MNKWRAIVFDLDDTLYPERDYVLSGFRAAALWAQAHLEIRAETGYEELKQLYEQGVRGDTFDRWLGSHSRSDRELVAALVQVYREHEPVLTPFPEVVPVLSALRKTHRLGLVSDGYLDVQQRKWKALKLAEYFDAVVFSDALGRVAWKPSPLPFEAALRQLKISTPVDAIYVADNPSKDFLGPRQLGMYTIRVRRAGGEYARREPLTPEHAPNITVADLAGLRHIILPEQDP